ncbi:hypothetical protein Hanom_Chr04g00345801 [Helianthus anomalus]
MTCVTVIVGMLCHDRFRIQADVTDGTMNTVVVLFDEIAEQLVKRIAKSLAEEQLQVCDLHGV